MIDVVVSGAGGRLGRRVVALMLESPDVRVVAGLVRPGSELEGRDLGGIVATADAAAAIRPGRVLVETAVRRAALEHAAIAADAGVPMLIATTGFEKAERSQLEAHGARCPVLIAANLSLGIAVLTDLVARAARALDGYHLEVLELHHAKKRDAPSGTAWALARAAAEARGRDIERDAIVARGGDIGPRGEHEVGMMSIRGGDIVGEHTVYLISATERVEITHRAQSRDAFAAGAIRAVELLGRPGLAPGLYTMRDVLGL